ncbi:hypothetical protein KAR91_29015 [Candidatus Pacearchaeota archaeon]|nr:hypothetical protein [Candidatus Pacearchaeota archaeon]
MLSEQITVTTTPTSIQQLIATARGTYLTVIPAKSVGIMLRYGIGETAIVSLSDEGSNTGAVVLDKANENLISTTLSQFSIEKALLSCNTGTVIVHIIVNQTLL